MTAASAPNGLRSVALWLGSSDRPLFAWLDLPEDGRVVGAAVICPSMGLEAAYSARGVRDLARRLVAAGWAALRIDYAATGDSAGSWTDPGLVDEWLRSVRTAIDYARGLGVPRVAVVGLRLGATLAAAELARGGPVDDVVLWDPSATGRAFLREQSALSAFRRDLAVQWGVLGKNETVDVPKALEEGSIEAPGVAFSAATVSDLKSLAIPTDQTLAARELILGRKGRSLERATRERLTLAHVESAEVEGQESLFEDQPVTPAATLDLIADWLTDRNEPATDVAVPDGHAVGVHPTHGVCAVREHAVELGPLGLFGILSEPEVPLPPDAPTVIFLNIGIINHQGPDRLWVDLARAWAGDARVRCLRVDLSGIGDSPTRPGHHALRPFPENALQDVTEIRRAVTGDRAGGVVLVGVCSGADHAIDSALFEPTAAHLRGESRPPLDRLEQAATTRRRRARRRRARRRRIRRADSRRDFSRWDGCPATARGRGPTGRGVHRRCRQSGMGVDVPLALASSRALRKRAERIALHPQLGLVDREDVVHEGEPDLDGGKTDGVRRPCRDRGGQPGVTPARPG